MSSKLVLVLNCGSSSLKFAIIDALNGDEYLWFGRMFPSA